MDELMFSCRFLVLLMSQWILLLYQKSCGRSKESKQRWSHSSFRIRHVYVSLLATASAPSTKTPSINFKDFLICMYFCFNLLLFVSWVNNALTFLPSFPTFLPFHKTFWNLCCQTCLPFFYEHMLGSPSCLFTIYTRHLAAKLVDFVYLSTIITLFTFFFV